MNTERAGLYGKYIIEKADGSPMNPEAEYLVLRLDNDETCRRAALAWSGFIQDRQPELAADIRAWVARLERGG